MSLINDALKRARQAQDQIPPSISPGPQLRPVETAPEVAHRSNLLVPALIVALVALVLFFAWQFVSNKGHAQSPKAGTPPAVASAPLPQPSKPTIAQPTSPAGALQTPPRTSAAPPAAISAEKLPKNTELSSAAPAPLVIGNSDNAKRVEKPLAPKAAPLKLQGVFFHPTRPAALISGQTVFVGDRIGKLRVLAIDTQSATLAGEGQTNVLRMPPQN